MSPRNGIGRNLFAGDESEMNQRILAALVELTASNGKLVASNALM